MRSSAFWFDAGERAVKTAAQALIALFVAGVTIVSIDWREALAVAATAALISVLTSIASSGVGDHDTASLVDAPGRHHAP